jgi:hypothetical protein
MKVTFEFNLSEADSMDTSSEVLMCIKARAMHNVLGNLLEHIDERLSMCERETGNFAELDDLRAWLIEEIQDEEVPGL